MGIRENYAQSVIPNGGGIYVEASKRFEGRKGDGCRASRLGELYRKHRCRGSFYASGRPPDGTGGTQYHRESPAKGEDYRWDVDQHRAFCGHAPGVKVRAEAFLKEINGRRLFLDIVVRDEFEEIARGQNEQIIVSADRFLETVKQKEALARTREGA